MNSAAKFNFLNEEEDEDEECIRTAENAELSSVKDRRLFVEDIVTDIY